MVYLLDASVLAPILIDLGEEVLRVASRVQLYVADLTLYETGNTLWKLVTLLRSMALEDALELVGAMQMPVTRGFIKVISHRELDPKKVLELAVCEKLTFYEDTLYGTRIPYTLSRELEDETSKPHVLQLDTHRGNHPKRSHILRPRRNGQRSRSQRVERLAGQRARKWASASLLPPALSSGSPALIRTPLGFPAPSTKRLAAIPLSTTASIPACETRLKIL